MSARPGPRLAGRAAALRRAKRAGLSIEEVADRLRLNEALVLAMEEDRFGLLGAPVFARGHLRNYAALVGAAEREIMDAFDAGDVPEPTFLPPSTARRLRGGMRGRWLAGARGASPSLPPAAVAWWLTRR